MEMKRLICSRNEHPDTCFLVEQEGQDYCMVCADALTEDEYTKNCVTCSSASGECSTSCMFDKCFTGAEITIPQIY